MFWHYLSPLSLVVRFLRRNVERFKINLSGATFLREVGGQPYILVANHVKPKNILLQMFGIGVDAFVLERVVKEQTRQRLNIVTNVTGKIGRIKLLRPIRGIDAFCFPIRERMMERAGFVPVRINPGSYNRHFLEIAGERIRMGEPIVLFPEGHWYYDFSPERKFKQGAALLAKKHNVPILPAYIRFTPRGVIIRIGKSFKPDGKTKTQVTQEIKERIADLQRSQSVD